MAAFGDILNDEEDHGGIILAVVEEAAADDHSAEADLGEIVIDAGIVELAVVGENVREHFAKRGIVPCSVVEFKDQAAKGLFGRGVEGLIERGGGAVDVEGSVEDEERLAQGPQNGVGIGVGCGIDLGVGHGQLSVVAGVELTILRVKRAAGKKKADARKSRDGDLIASAYSIAGRQAIWPGYPLFSHPKTLIYYKLRIADAT